jgi:hypothetical protein
MNATLLYHRNGRNKLTVGKLYRGLQKRGQISFGCIQFECWQVAVLVIKPLCLSLSPLAGGPKINTLTLQLNQAISLLSHADLQEVNLCQMRHTSLRDVVSVNQKIIAKACCVTCILPPTSNKDPELPFNFIFVLLFFLVILVLELRV